MAAAAAARAKVLAAVQNGGDGAQTVATAWAELAVGEDPVAPSLTLSRGSCGRVLGRGDMMVCCVTCQADASCMVCMQCFEKDKHVGHDYRVCESNGGVCDCGDKTAWNPAGFCSKHQGVTAETDPLQGIPEEVVSHSTAVVEAVVALVVEDCKRMLLEAQRAEQDTDAGDDASASPTRNVAAGDALSSASPIQGDADVDEPSLKKGPAYPVPQDQPSVERRLEGLLPATLPPGETAVVLMKKFLIPLADISNATCRVISLVLMKGLDTRDYEASPHAVVLRAASYERPEGALPQPTPLVIQPIHDLRKACDKLYHRLFIDFHLRTLFALHFVRDIPGSLKPAARWQGHASVQFLTVASVIEAISRPDPDKANPGVFHALTKAMHDNLAVLAKPLMAPAVDRNAGSDGPRADSLEDGDDEWVSVDDDEGVDVEVVDNNAGDAFGELMAWVHAGATVEALLAMQDLAGAEGEDDEEGFESETTSETSSSTSTAEDVPAPAPARATPAQAARPAVAGPARGPQHVATAAASTAADETGLAADAATGVLTVEGISSRARLDLFDYNWRRTTRRGQLRAGQHEVLTHLFQCLRQPGFTWHVLGTPLLRHRVLIHLLLFQQGLLQRRLDLDTDSLEYLNYETNVMYPTFTQILPEGVAAAPSLAAAKEVLDSTMLFMREFTKTLFVGVWEELCDARVPATAATVATTADGGGGAAGVASIPADVGLPWIYRSNPLKNIGNFLTFQLPLHRFLAEGLHAVLLKQPDVRLADVLSVDEFVSPAGGYLEPVVTMFTTRAQVYAGLWRRNHMRIADQAEFHARLARDYDFAYQDLFFMQIATVAAGPTAVAFHLARRFTASGPLVADELTTPEYDMLPEFLRLIIQIATDRTKTTASQKALLRARVLLCLATGAKKFSTIVDEVLHDADERPALAVEVTTADLQGILKEVADTVSKRQGLTYSLKKEAWEEVTPYSVSWRAGKVVKAEEERARVTFQGCAEKQETLPLSCPHPRVPDMTALRPVVGLLHADIVVATAVATLARVVARSSSGEDTAAEAAAVRCAVDILVLALRTLSEYNETYTLVAARETATRALAKECEGAARLFPSSPSGAPWLAHSANTGSNSNASATKKKKNKKRSEGAAVAKGAGGPPTCIADTLAACNAETRAGSALHVLHDLRALPAHSDLWPGIDEIVARAQEASPAARAVVERITNVDAASPDGVGSPAGAASDAASPAAKPTVAAKRKAKGKARQLAAMQKLQKQQAALGIDIDSDDGEGVERGASGDDVASPTEGGDEHRTSAAHAYMDAGYLDENEACCICSMAVSPHNTTELVQMALCTTGKGLSGCAREARPRVRRQQGGRPRHWGEGGDTPPAKAMKLGAGGERRRVSPRRADRGRELPAADSDVDMPSDGDDANDDVEVVAAAMGATTTPLPAAGIGEVHRRPLTIVHICTHVVHAACLHAHMKSRRSWRGGPALEENEFLCPLCRRLGDALIPLIAPEPPQPSSPPPPQAAQRMHSHRFPPLLTTVPDANKGDIGRDDRAVEDLLRDVATRRSPEARDCGAPLRATTHCRTLYFPDVLARAVGANLPAATADAVPPGTRLCDAWGMQIVAAEMATRLPEESRNIPVRKLVLLRTQLKITVAHLAAESGSIDASGLQALLGVGKRDDATAGTGPPLTDPFGAWVHAVLFIALRDPNVGHAGLRYLTRRALEAKAAWLQLATEGVEALVTDGAVVSRVEYIERELAVLATWLAIASASILARFGDDPDGGGDAVQLQDAALRLPAVWETTSPADALAAAGGLLDAVACVGREYTSLAGVSDALARRDAAAGPRIATVGVWAAGWKVDAGARRGCALMATHYAPRLVEVPRDFHEVMAKYYRATPCSRCSTVPKNVVLCLACGDVLCIDERKITAPPSCGGPKHAATCGGGHAVYLSPRTSGLIACGGRRVFKLPPFYLDAHGEADPSLLRGRPLFLDPARLAQTLHAAALNLYAYDTQVLHSALLVR